MILLAAQGQMPGASRCPHESSCVERIRLDNFWQMQHLAAQVLLSIAMHAANLSLAQLVPIHGVLK
jgi:hypothetical protein